MYWVIIFVVVLLASEVSSVSQKSCIGGSYRDGIVSDEYLYTVTECGLNIYDWRGIKPKQVGGLQTEGTAQGIAINGTTVLIADGDSGVLIIDTSDLTLPKVVGKYQTKSALKIEIITNLNIAVIATGIDGIDIISLESPSKPILLVKGFKYENHKSTTAIKRYQTNTIIVTGLETVAALNITNPKMPTLLSSTSVVGTPHGIQFDQLSYVYVLQGSQGIGVVDCKNISLISLIKNEPTPGGSATSMLILSDTAFVGDGRQLSEFNISDRSSPTKGSSVGTELRLSVANTISQVVSLSNGVVGVLCGNNLFSVKSLSNGLSLAGMYSNINIVPASVATSSMLYLSDVSTSLIVINISNPMQPNTLSRSSFGLQIPFLVSDMVLVESLSFVVICYDDGVVVVDISNSVSPTLVKMIDVNCTSIATFEENNDKYIIASDGDGFQIYNLITFASVGNSFPWKGLQSIGVGVINQKPVALLVSDSKGMALLDLSQPALVSVLWENSFITLPSSNGIIISETGIAIVNGLNYGITLFDLSDLDKPKLLSSVELVTTMQSTVSTNGDLIYVSTSDGFSEIDFSNPKVPTILQNISVVGATYLTDPLLSISFSDVDGGVIYYAIPGQLEIWSISTPSSPSPVPAPFVPAHHESETDDNLVLIIILAATIPISLSIIAGIYVYSDKKIVKFHPHDDENLMELE